MPQRLHLLLDVLCRLCVRVHQCLVRLCLVPKSIACSLLDHLDFMLWSEPGPLLSV